MHINTSVHIPVMPKEVLEALAVKPGGTYIDGTVGYGGHSSLILKELSASGSLYCFDWDKATLDTTKKEFDSIDKRKQTTLIHGSYTDIPKYVHTHNIKNIDGILIDLGFSSGQIDTRGRGFSFSDDLSLDMRFDISSILITAKEVLTSHSEEELANIFFIYGDERRSRKIAKEIVHRRKKETLVSGKQFAKWVCDSLGIRTDESGVPKKYFRVHPATKVFQALRIYVNHEYENIAQAIKELPELLGHDGRLVFITFHSGEDRIVKHLFKDIITNTNEYELVYKKAIQCSRQEEIENPRARSAIVRALKRK